MKIPDFLKKNLFSSMAVLIVAIILGVAYLQGEEPDKAPAPTPTVSPTPLPSAAFIAPLPTDSASPSPSPQSVTPTPTADSGAADTSEEKPAASPLSTETPMAVQTNLQAMPSPTPATAPTPAPVIEENHTESAMTCTFSIRCDTLLGNSALPEEKKGLIPPDGVILSATSVPFSEGESVFNLLRRLTRQNGIHLEFTKVPAYGSAYIEGIQNLYEFDCGSGSGWMYKVDGIFPRFGCSQYTLTPGCAVEFVYTCNLGHDVGGGYAPRNGA